MNAVTRDVSTDLRPRLVVSADLFTRSARGRLVSISCYADVENGPSADDIPFVPDHDAIATALCDPARLSAQWETAVPEEVVALRYYFRLPKVTR